VSTTSIRLYGDWGKFDTTMRRAMGMMSAAMDAGIKAAADLARKELVRGVERGSPGGQRLRPPSRGTLLARRMAGISGTRALISTGRVYGSMEVMREGLHRYRVGVPSRNGLAEVARLHEHGAGPFYVRITPKMMAYLAAAGILNGDGRSGSGRGYAVIRIPARPVFAPMTRAILARPEPYIRAARAAFASRLGHVLGR
jgi:hypothetical protein